MYKVVIEAEKNGGFCVIASDGIVLNTLQVNSVKLLKQISIVILIYYLHHNQSRLSRAYAAEFQSVVAAF